MVHMIERLAWYKLQAERWGALWSSLLPCYLTWVPIVVVKRGPFSHHHRIVQRLQVHLLSFLSSLFYSLTWQTWEHPLLLQWSQQWHSHCHISISTHSICYLSVQPLPSIFAFTAISLFVLMTLLPLPSILTPKLNFKVGFWPSKVFYLMFHCP